MKELFSKLLPIFCENGGRLVDFYDLSYAEIMIVIESNRSRVKQEMQINASMIYAHARLLSYSFSDPSKMPTIAETFPSLFDDAKAVEAQPVQQEWRLMKDILLGYSDKHNDKFRKEE